jgi:hypothetical protein
VFLRWAAREGISLVVDPCAGEGAILRVAAAEGFRVGGIELREECRPKLDALIPGGAIYGDALAPGGMAAELRNVLRFVPGGAIITNRRFSVAQVFFETCRYGRMSVWLLRLNFPASQRAAWLRGDGRPSNVLVLGDRRSRWGHDSCEYAVVWPGLGARATTTFLEVLDVE